MKCEIDLIEPRAGSYELTPGTACELTIRYKNTGTVTHHVESILLEPTWDLSKQRTIEIKTKVPEDTSSELTGIKREVPEGLAGRHGFRIGIKTRALSNDTRSDDTEIVWMDSIRRFEVTGTGSDEHKALVCFSEGDDEYKLIHQLLEDYGYNPELISRQSEIVSREKPSLVFGVALSESVNLISSAMTWAAPDRVYGTQSIEEFDGNGTGTLILQHKDVSSDELPVIGMVHEEVSTVERLAIEETVGPYLFKMRLLDGAGVLEYVYELASALKTNPKDLIATWSTNQIIQATELVTRRTIVKSIIYLSGLIVTSKSINKGDDDTINSMSLFHVEIADYSELSDGRLGIDYKVENQGIVDDRQDIVLEVDDIEVDSVSRYVPPGGARTGTLSWSIPQRSGRDYTIKIHSEDDSTIQTISTGNADLLSILRYVRSWF